MKHLFINRVKIGSGNGLSSLRYQIITWNSASINYKLGNWEHIAPEQTVEQTIETPIT